MHRSSGGRNKMQMGDGFMFLELILSVISNIAYLVLNVSSPGKFPPPLSAKKEAEYIEKMLSGDEASKNILIEHNLRLVAHIVKKYYSSGIEAEDLISVGTIGLIKGISTYKRGKGIKLATYASRCIENEILMCLRFLKKTAQDVPISDPIDTDKEGNHLTLSDIIADEADVAEDIEMKLRLEGLKSAIKSELTAREQKIIEMRYGLSDYFPLPQREVAKRLHISRSYVSRIEKKALEKLKIKLQEG